jgi:hypothetical protein
MDNIIPTGLQTPKQGKGWCFLVPQKQTEDLHSFLLNKVKFYIIQDWDEKQDQFYLDSSKTEKFVKELIDGFSISQKSK